MQTGLLLNEWMECTLCCRHSKSILAHLPNSTPHRTPTTPDVPHRHRQPSPHPTDHSPLSPVSTIPMLCLQWTPEHQIMPSPLAPSLYQYSQLAIRLSPGIQSGLKTNPYDLPPVHSPANHISSGSQQHRCETTNHLTTKLYCAIPLLNNHPPT